MTNKVNLFDKEEKQKALVFIRLGLAERFYLTPNQVDFMIPKSTRPEWLEKHWLTAMIDMLQVFGISPALARSLILKGERGFMNQEMLVSTRGGLSTLSEHKALTRKSVVTEEVIENLQKSKYLMQKFRDRLDDDGDY